MGQNKKFRSIFLTVSNHDYIFLIFFVDKPGCIKRVFTADILLDEVDEDEGKTMKEGVIAKKSSDKKKFKKSLQTLSIL